MLQTSTPLIVTFVVYLLGMMVIGFYAWRATKDFDDYILGGRKLGSTVTALSAGASDMSGWLMMGLPGALYLNGLSEAWIALGLTVGAWLNWRYVAGPLRVYTERTGNALTLPDYLTNRFHDKSRALRVFAALVILVFFSVYCASGAVAGARLFESVFGLPYAQAIWWGAAVTIAYTLIGGFLAVSWTDVAQGSMMLFALIVTPVMIVVAGGGFDGSVELVREIDPSRLQWVGAGGLVAIVSALAWGLGYFGQPHILARFMAAESVHAIPRARLIGMSWMILCLLGALAVGFFGISYFSLHPEHAGPVEANPERVFITAVEILFNPWVAGVVLSAILAAVMSTLSSQLLVCSSVLSEDFYRGFLRRYASQRELVWVGRASVLIVSVVAVWLARDPESRVLGLVAYAWAGFGAAFGPVLVLSLFWGRMTRDGALAGMVVGAVTVIAWKEIAVGRLGFQLYEMVPGCIAATAVIVAVSLLGRQPAQDIRTTHEQVRLSLRETGY